MNRFTPTEYRPAWWLPGPHLQTLGARYLRATLRLPFVRERIELPDGDFVDLDFAYRKPEEDGRPIVLLLHGLEGSARSGYAMVTYRMLREQQIYAVGLNFRSCSGEINRLPRMYHSGETGDLGYVLPRLRARYPDRRFCAIGVSLGGNVLLKYLGTTGDDARSLLDAAVAISVPFVLAEGAKNLKLGVNPIYVRHLLSKLKEKLRIKRELMPKEVDVARALAASDFREFDDAATAPLHGFDGAEDYYARSSSGRYLDGIRVPTLLIHSRDDPFLPAAAVPESAPTTNPRISAAFTDRGGHVGFVTGSMPLRPEYWAEREAVRFVSGR
jgi:predicted alpha/beta-fold hydrolase